MYQIRYKTDATNVRLQREFHRNKHRKINRNFCTVYTRFVVYLLLLCCWKHIKQQNKQQNHGTVKRANPPTSKAYTVGAGKPVPRHLSQRATLV